MARRDDDRQFTLAELKKMHELSSRTPEEEWLTASGQSPLEFLADTYRDPRFDVKDRIAAARSVLEYAHKKLPTDIAVSGQVNGILDPKKMSQLSDEEIDILVNLLAKLK